LAHWRQPRRRCRGHIPPMFWLGGRQREYPPILLRTFGYSRPILVALRSLSLKPISFGCKTPPIRFSQAGGQSPFGGSSPQPRTRVDATALAPLTEILRTFLVKDCPRADLPALPRAQFYGCCRCCCCTWQISACQLVSDASIPWDAQ